MLHDVFICHASEDKEEFVRPLAEALRAENIDVWYDEFSLRLGDSIRRSIDCGLRESRFGVVVLSKAFFAKQWPQYELDGLVEREMRGNDRVLLPVWHNVNRDDVFFYSPSLADRKALLTRVGLEAVVADIRSVVHPRHSPLIIARDTLLEWGVTPPVITDSYWLRVVTASNRVPGSGASIPEESHWGRWSFPLPWAEVEDSAAMGERLAWTAMQLRWVAEAESLPVTPLTPPAEVLAFIDRHPGLWEISVQFPDLLVEYAPQLSIRGFGGSLEDAIEGGYRRSCERTLSQLKLNPTAARHWSRDGEPTVCDEEWALRAPDFGHYKPGLVANAYFAGGMFGPDVSPYEHADHLFWLLSRASTWLPPVVRSFLIDGMAHWPVWHWAKDDVRFDGQHVPSDTTGALLDATHHCAFGHRPFQWTAEIEHDVLARIEVARQLLRLPEPSATLLAEFRNHRLPERRIATHRRDRRAQLANEKRAQR
ncbi:MAG: toll/interleukin-1 receptor domain-containing protein [Chloroflexi bacterium]|nr:toll/interleukin-1 receptor domain-containing protein [Chloroflexota bacterium]